jgi:PPM family protein phosphatase
MNLANIFCLYEIGGKRNQEDYVWPVPGAATAEDTVFIVCDGVGGSENGEIASKVVSEFVGASLNPARLSNISIEYINALLQTAKERLVAYAKEQHLSRNMATTFSLLALADKRAFIAWCGDSRIYHLRNDQIVNKSSDHSLVNTLVKKGELTEAEASSHPQKHLILKAVKADSAAIEAEGYWIDDVQPGDFFLLCTDGLLENVSDRDLLFLIKQYRSENIDLVDSFQKMCKGKTKDNYSMYLLETSGESQVQKHNSWKHPLIAFAFLLTITAVLGYYYKNPIAADISSGPSTPGNTTSKASVATDTAHKGKVTNPKEGTACEIRYHYPGDTAKTTRKQGRSNRPDYANQNRSDSAARPIRSGAN